MFGSGKFPMASFEFYNLFEKNRKRKEQCKICKVVSHLKLI